MENHNEKGGASSQTIEHFKVLFSAAGAVKANRRLIQS
jgi:hypothetical protein